jgi:hypothetical protein
VAIPTPLALSKIIRRKRKAEHIPYAVPHTVAEINIPIAMRTTHRGANFLLFDSGPIDNDRFILFGTRENLKHLGDFPHWFIDGPFKVAPELFYQVFLRLKLILAS